MSFTPPQKPVHFVRTKGLSDTRIPKHVKFTIKPSTQMKKKYHIPKKSKYVDISNEHAKRYYRDYYDAAKIYTLVQEERGKKPFPKTRRIIISPESEDFTASTLYTKKGRKIEGVKLHIPREHQKGLHPSEQLAGIIEHEETHLHQKTSPEEQQHIAEVNKQVKSDKDNWRKTPEYKAYTSLPSEQEAYKAERAFRKTLKKERKRRAIIRKQSELESKNPEAQQEAILSSLYD